MILFVLLIHLIFDPFVYNQYLQIIVIRRQNEKEKMNIPDDNVVSLFEPVVADEDVVDEDEDDEDVVSACIHGGPWIIEPNGG
jgi:hypothetical protein